MMSNGFSFDLFPEMTEQVNAAYRRASQIAPRGLAEVVKQRKPEIGLTQEEEAWADNQLRWSAISWNPYKKVFPDLPKSLDELHQTHLSLVPTLKHLYAASEALKASGQIAPENPSSSSMQLVLIPWQYFTDPLLTDNQLAAVRKLQHIREPDYTPSVVRKNVFGDGDQRIYINPNSSKRHTAREYLQHRMEQDGPWGVALIQDSNEPGALPFQYMAPGDHLAADTGLELSGYNVGAMGIFEWLAYTMQCIPASRVTSLLPANRLRFAGSIKILVGYKSDDCYGTEMAGRNDRIIQPRLAVMYDEAQT